METPGFWEKKEEAIEIEKQGADLREEINLFESLQRQVLELEEFLSLEKEGSDLSAEIQTRIAGLAQKIKEISLKTYLGGKDDAGEAILQIFAGAGGRDAQDWAAMLLRMYERYFESRGFEAKVLEQSFGEAGGPEGRVGIKNATIEVKAGYAFGLLKGEAGVHRLVRISPFSSQELRHTSFAQVVVLPRIKDARDLTIEIKPDDLKVETFRSSGPGGQYMQKTESAVRLTHLPTKIVVCCQSERLQAINKKKALEILYSRLYQLERQKQREKIKEMKGEVDASWGRQIRSYVFHPYKLVKDLRTGMEKTNVEAVLNGGIDDFIEAEVKL